MEESRQKQTSHKTYHYEKTEGYSDDCYYHYVYCYYFLFLFLIYCYYYIYCYCYGYRNYYYYYYYYYYFEKVWIRRTGMMIRWKKGEEM